MTFQLCIMETDLVSISNVGKCLRISLLSNEEVCCLRASISEGTTQHSLDLAKKIFGLGREKNSILCHEYLRLEQELLDESS